MIEQKELVTLKGQVSRLENQATAVTITSQEEYIAAGDIVNKLKDVGSTIKEKKEAITKPLNESLRNIRALFAPIESQYEIAETIIKRKLLDYKRKADDEARAKELAIAARLEAGKIKMQTAERKIAAIEIIPGTVQGKAGEINVRKVKKVRITNESLLPRTYLLPDTVRIRHDALAGIHIPGTEVYEEEIIAATPF